MYSCHGNCSVCVCAGSQASTGDRDGSWKPVHLTVFTSHPVSRPVGPWYQSYLNYKCLVKCVHCIRVSSGLAGQQSVDTRWCLLAGEYTGVWSEQVWRSGVGMDMWRNASVERWKHAVGMGMRSNASVVFAGECGECMEVCDTFGNKEFVISLEWMWSGIEECKNSSREEEWRWRKCGDGKKWSCHGSVE